MKIKFNYFNSTYFELAIKCIFKYLKDHSSFKRFDSIFYRLNNMDVFNFYILSVGKD